MINVQVYQIYCKIYLMKDVGLSHMLEEISNFIDLGLAQDERMLKFHEGKGYKNYVHSGFNELERDKIYKEGKIYSFSIRTIDKELKDYFLKTLRDINTETMKGLVTSVKQIKKVHITKLYSITPALIKTDSGYWKGKIDFETYEKRLLYNSIKKTKSILEDDFNEDFVLYNSIQILNRKPISSSFKNISLLGDKLELIIADNKKAQEIAYILLGTGILENNPRGYGFVNYKS